MSWDSESQVHASNVLRSKVDCMYNELALNGFGWVFPPQSQP